MPRDAGPVPPLGGGVPWRVRRQEQHAHTPPPISRHVRGDRFHASRRNADWSCLQRRARGAPDPVSSVEVTATDSSSVTVAWPPSRDNSVTGYTVYLNSVRVGTQTPDQVRRWRDRDILTYTLSGSPAARATPSVSIRSTASDRHSKPTTTTVSTAACPDTAAPSAPTGIRQTASTESSVVLAWTPSTDNVGVVEYGLYASGLRVTTASDASATLTGLSCGKSYLIALDAADAAGNRSAQTSAFYKTSACPSTNKPPTTPTVVKVTAATDTTVALSWTASTDDVAVTGYGLYLSGSRTSETTGTTGQFTGLKCGTTYALGVDAKDAAGLRSAPANLSTATSPCTSTTPPTGSITQTIANGSTVKGVVSWFAVYDGNGDKVEDDPGSVRVASSTAISSAPSSTSRSATTPASGRPPRLRTAPTPSRCAPSTAPAPCSPRTRSPRRSPTPQHRPDRRARSLRRSRTVRP